MQELLSPLEFENLLRQQHHRYHHLHPFHQRMNAGELTPKKFGAG